MAPVSRELSKCLEAESVSSKDKRIRVVISGMSGLYPESNSIEELSHILYNKIYPITNKSLRWNYNHPELIPYMGKVLDIKKFDAQFFKVHFRMGEAMDFICRKLLEQAFQAIYDAGVNPQKLYGKKVGVYIGTSSSETEKVNVYNHKKHIGHSILGCSKSMFANRISYWLNLKGPSLNFVEACCSSTRALEQAYLAIVRGECEAAIVGGANICLHPQTSVLNGRTMKHSSDGKTRSFDNNAAGLALSEAINVLFLQKAEDALRLYAEIVHAKCEYTSLIQEETGPNYGFYRNSDTTAEFIEFFYKEVNVSPTEVEYVEAFGSAVPDADKAELEALEKVYCKEERHKPLLVGSVMSNIGYTESASGISAITKVLLAYSTGKIAGNLHYNTPRKDVKALRDGRMRIVSDHETLNGNYIAVNGLSIGGVNSHILLYNSNIIKDVFRYKSNIPQLVTLSGRREQSVLKILSDLKSRPIDPEELALLRNIHEIKIPGHLERGFIILDSDENNITITLREKTVYFDKSRRPLWFVYSGMESQWTTMGLQLMRIPIFAAAIEKCRRVLEPHGIDIVNVITSNDKKVFDNILNSFVGIAAIQIGLTDVLKKIGVYPDKIIGHSVGELGCAYADGCFTAEEMILTAYYRGLVSVQTSLIPGKMAVVGIGYQEIQKYCPPEVDVACHNGPQSCTISGPTENVTHFVNILQKKGIFAKEFASSNIAYHSRYITKMGPILLKYLTGVIKSPKPRTERWVSTSVPQDRWNEPITKYSSAEYHTNNLLSPVLFEETLSLVPHDAILIEIAPHGLLQAILKRSLPVSCKNIPLTRRGHPDNAQHLLEAIGNLYLEGNDVKLQNLYPKIEFPVSSGTPMLSHLVEWIHEENWFVPQYVSAEMKKSATCNHILSIYDDEHNYLRGHVIREKTIYPFAAALVMVWDTLAMILGVEKKQLSVQFLNVHLYSQPAIHKQRQLRFHVSIQKTGQFEVMNENIKVATGFIVETMNDEKLPELICNLDENMQLSSKDIYQLFYIRDYNYKRDFCSIHRSNLTLTKAEILWRKNWVTLIDGMFQLNILRRTHETVSQVNYIRKMTIDVKKHFDCESSETDGLYVLPISVSDIQETTRCGGITIDHIQFNDLLPLYDNKLKQLKFLPSSPNSTFGEKTERKWSEAANNRLILRSSKPGDLNSLLWEESSKLSCNGVPVKVYYAGINNKYVKKVFEENKPDKSKVKEIEVDFSGVTKNGTRVMGIVLDEGISTHVVAKPEMLWSVPEHWSLEDAATVPLAYSMALYCLFVKSSLNIGYQVLVHGGAGALGQAVISIALAYDCDVYVTVSDNKKKRFLMSLFPKLKERYIGNSRDNTFGDMVLQGTKGKGCDIIISCVQNELKHITINCSSTQGVIIDTSLLSNHEDFVFGMNYLNICRSYVIINFSEMFDPSNIHILRKLQMMMCESIARGYVRPLSRVTYTPDVVPRAFRLHIASQHRGRVLLDMQGDKTVMPKLHFDSNSCHLLLSNDEIIGMQLADRLISRGAKKLVLHWEKESNALQFKLRVIEKKGVITRISNGNIWNEDDFVRILENSKSLGPIEGVHYTICYYEESWRKNIENLAVLAQKTCPTLKYFVVIDTKNINISNKISLIKTQEKKLSWIQLSNTGKSDNIPHFDDIISPIYLTNAIERALCCKGSMMFENIKPERVPVLQELADITGIIIPDEVSEDTTFMDLATDPSKLVTVGAYLRDFHNISITVSNILSLTIKTILNLDESTSTSTVEDVNGLQAFYSKVDPDELEATRDFLFLPSLGYNTEMCGDEFKEHTYMYLVPGVEGHYSKFLTLCERLKIPVVALQPGIDFPQETIKEMAIRYVKILLEKAELKDNFNIIAYESGVLIALEMAAILEYKGFTGIVFCIGGSPDEVKVQFTDKLRDYNTKEKLQHAVLKHMYKLITNKVPENMDEVLQNITWKDKLDAFIKKIKNDNTLSSQYAYLLTESAYNRLEQVLEYNTEIIVLRSKLVSLRPKLSKSSKISLQKYSLKTVVEYDLPSSLALITEDLRCAPIINRHLDKDLLNKFDQRNLCESYVLSPFKFTTQDD